MIPNSDAHEINVMIAFVSGRLDEEYDRYCEAAGDEADQDYAINQCPDGNEGYIVAEALLNLRDVAAKRRIVEDFRIAADAARRVGAADLNAPGFDTLRAGRDALKSVVRLLAQRWSDHPEYKSWRS